MDSEELTEMLADGDEYCQYYAAPVEGSNQLFEDGMVYYDEMAPMSGINENIPESFGNGQCIEASTENLEQNHGMYYGAPYENGQYNGTQNNFQQFYVAPNESFVDGETFQQNSEMWQQDPQMYHENFVDGQGNFQQDPQMYHVDGQGSFQQDSGVYYENFQMCNSGQETEGNFQQNSEMYYGASFVNGQVQNEVHNFQQNPGMPPQGNSNKENFDPDLLKYFGTFLQNGPGESSGVSSGEISQRKKRGRPRKNLGKLPAVENPAQGNFDKENFDPNFMKHCGTFMQTYQSGPGESSGSGSRETSKRRKLGRPRQKKSTLPAGLSDGHRPKKGRPRKDPNAPRGTRAKIKMDFTKEEEAYYLSKSVEKYPTPPCPQCLGRGLQSYGRGININTFPRYKCINCDYRFNVPDGPLREEVYATVLEQRKQKKL